LFLNVLENISRNIFAAWFKLKALNWHQMYFSLLIYFLMTFLCLVKLTKFYRCMSKKKILLSKTLQTLSQICHFIVNTFVYNNVNVFLFLNSENILSVHVFPAGGEADFWNISSSVLSGSELYKNLSFSRPMSIFFLVDPLLSPFTKLFPLFFTALIFLLFFVQVQSSANG